MDPGCYKFKTRSTEPMNMKSFETLFEFNFYVNIFLKIQFEQSSGFVFVLKITLH